MRILAIDLGHTSGYVWTDGIALVAGACKLEDLTFKCRGFDVDAVIIERPAYRERPDVQESYEAVLSALRMYYNRKGVRVLTCRPADWMPRFHGFPLPGRGVLKTQHEKDAYRMAHWALDKFGGQK